MGEWAEEKSQKAEIQSDVHLSEQDLNRSKG